MEYNPKFVGPVKVYVYNGMMTGQGEMWVPIDGDLEKIFEIMINGRTVMLMREEDTGVMYSADTGGPDKKMDHITYLREKGRYKPIKPK